MCNFDVPWDLSRVLFLISLVICQGEDSMFLRVVSKSLKTTLGADILCFSMIMRPRGSCCLNSSDLVREAKTTKINPVSPPLKD